MANNRTNSYLGHIQNDLSRIRSELAIRKIESLRLQRKVLTGMVSRHGLWSTDTSRPDAASLHTQIAASIQNIIDEYDSVLAIYEGDST